MGWTGTTATFWKNGRIDRKAECDDYFMGGLNAGHFEVLKSTMKGSVYYAAVRTLKKYAGEDENGKSIYLPLENGPVWAAVFLTSTEKYTFYYKDMSEEMGPCEAECPASILDLLGETDSEWANNWRKRCRENIEKAKNPNTLKNLPIGAVIRFVLNGRSYEIEKKAPNYQFKRAWWYVLATHTYIPSHRIPANYEVVTV